MVAYNRKIDEGLQIDTELSTDFWNKCPKLIDNERRIAKRLHVTYQTYFVFNGASFFLL